MFDLIKKTMLTGVGLASMTKDKLEAIAKEIAEKEKLSEKEGRDLVNDLLKKSEEAKKKLENHVDALVRDIMKKMNLATKDELSALRQEVEKLEEALKEKGTSS